MSTLRRWVRALIINPAPTSKARDKPNSATTNRSRRRRSLSPVLDVRPVSFNESLTFRFVVPRAGAKDLRLPRPTTAEHSQPGTGGQSVLESHRGQCESQSLSDAPLHVPV